MMKFFIHSLFLCISILFLVNTVAISAEVTQQVDGFMLEGFNEEGDRTWEVKGDTADIFGETIKISNVDANAYGQQEVNLTAKQGELDKKSGNIHLQEDVVITTKDGSQLKTDSLDWQKTENIISTQDPAEIIDKTMKATGIGLTAHSELKTAQLERNVTVELDAENSIVDQRKQQVIITCDGPMEMDQQNNTATFKENVVAVRGDQTLKADLVEVYFDQETRKIVTII